MPRYAHHANLLHYQSYTPPCKYDEHKVTVHRRRHTHHTYAKPAAAEIPNDTPEPHEDGNPTIGENTEDKNYNNP